MGADLAIRDLVIEYSSGGYRVRPIDGLNLDAGSGELVLLLGASGCGKTTLLSVCAAILTPTSGSVRVAGTEVVGLKGAALTEYRRKTVGIVFQAFNLVPSLTAVENVMVPLRAAGVPRKEARARAIELLERVDLGERLHHRPSGMSGGQQQRVAIARALAHDPPVFLADEPTAHLDYIQVEGVLKLLREVADDGRLVVVATHDDRMIPLADRVREPHAARPKPSPVNRCASSSADGDVVFRQGDRSDLVYIVEDGRASRSCAPARTASRRSLPSFRRARTSASSDRCSGCSARRPHAPSGPAVLTGFGLREFREKFQIAATDVLTQAAD